MRCIRRSSINAVKSTHAIFANSDGWKLMPAKVSHRLAPLTGGRTARRPGAGTTTRKHRPDQRVVPVRAVVDAHRDRQHRDPEHRPQGLPDQEVIGILVPSRAAGAEALYTMTTLAHTSRMVATKRTWSDLSFLATVHSLSRT